MTIEDVIEMSENGTDTSIERRMYLKLAAAAGGATALAGCSGNGDDDGDDAEAGSTPAESSGGNEESTTGSSEWRTLKGEAADVRMDTADFVPARQFYNDNYERMHLYRKRRAIDTLLADPEVNELASDWMMGFEAYEVLGNHLETVSIQGTPELDIQVEGWPDGDETEFEITAVDRQTVFGIIDRHNDRIVAAHITDPQDVEWPSTKDEEEMELGQRILDHDVVKDKFGELEVGEWYTEGKGPTSSIGGIGRLDAEQDDRVGTARIMVDRGDHLGVVTAYIDDRGNGEPEIPVVEAMDQQVEYPLRMLAENINPVEESVIDDVPDVPFEQRPPYTAPDGFHRLEDPPDVVEDSGWTIEWEPADLQGVTYSVDYNDKPVFESMNVPNTMTGYYLPPKEGQKTKDWYFPEGNSIWAGDLLFWDILGRDGFGGPGMMGKFDFPANSQRGTPSGFRFKNHYHTGAEDRESQDFHSGIRFGPYNYDYSYDFFDDGVLDLVFRRAGPGYIMEWVQRRHEEQGEYGENGGYEEPVVQHYSVYHAMDVTPGTTEGVEVELFDGDEMYKPEEEFYMQGSEGMMVKFSNPDGPETIKVPLDDDNEIIVQQRDETQVGPGDSTATRLSDDLDHIHYHPAQYVEDERPIQGERLIVWLVQVGETNGLSYPSGSTNFATSDQIELSGY